MVMVCNRYRAIAKKRAYGLAYTGIGLIIHTLPLALVLGLAPMAVLAQAQGEPPSQNQNDGPGTARQLDQLRSIPQEPLVPLPAPASRDALDRLYPPPAKGKAPFSAAGQDPSPGQVVLAEGRAITLDQIAMSELLPIGRGKLPPIRLEASFNEVLSLKDALNYTLANSLPIRISQAAADVSKYQYYSSLGQLLPDFQLNYRGQYTDSAISPPSRLFTFSPVVRYPVFAGGANVFGALVARNRAKAAKNAFGASINDALLDVYRRYNDLLLAHLLLRIRVKSVELSRAQLSLNEQLKNAGVGTNFAIFQSRTQLANDKQALLQQEVAVRQAALQLAVSLNASVAVNFFPQDFKVAEARLFDQDMNVAQLEASAAKFRPELKQYEYLRVAAARNIQVAAAPLYPSLQFFTTGTLTQSSGRSGSNASLAGSTVIIPTGSGGGGIGISGGGGRYFSAGFDLSWSLNGLGVPDAFNTQAARAQARQATLQANQQIITVLQQVRSSYLNMQTADEQVDVAAEAVTSAGEQLRLANLRLRYGQGINLELIQAQRDYINALTTQAQAIIAYNVSQAQLLRDTGLISVSALTGERPARL